MADKNKLEWSIKCCKALSKGIDPITGKQLPPTDIVNNSHVSNCMAFIAGILQQVLENDGEVQREALKRDDKAPFSLTYEQMQALTPSKETLSSSNLVKLINERIDSLTMRSLKATALNKWLVGAGLLREDTVNGRTVKVPTEAGEQLGLKVVEGIRKDTQERYRFVVFSPGAQQVVFDNLDQIAAYAAIDEADALALKEQKAANDHEPWTQEMDDQLTEMFRNNATLKTMSDQLMRRQIVIKRRLEYLGLASK